jgi:hypothetical protein
MQPGLGKESASPPLNEQSITSVNGSSYQKERML